MGVACSCGRGLAGVLSLLVPIVGLSAESRADGNDFRGQVLQSGHVGGDWTRRPAHGNGLALTFEERDRAREDARREMRRHLKRHLEGHLESALAEMPLPSLSLFSQDGLAGPDGPDAGLLGVLGEDVGLAGSFVGGTEMDLRPFAAFRADLEEAEARAGLRLRWGRDLDLPAHDGGLRAYLFADWEGRAGLDDVFGGAETTGGHDLDTGLSLSVGAWSLTVESNVAGSGFGDREGHGTSGWLGYAIRW